MRIGFFAFVALVAGLIATAASMNVSAGDGAVSAPRDRWTAEEVATIASLRLSELPPPPADPSNSAAVSPVAAALGKRLFNDTRLSRSREVAYATCHAAEQQFQDGRPTGRGVAIGKRRTVPTVGFAYSPWLFWDGRKDSAW